MTLES
jgi:mitogen-activated protein kinase 1/3